MLSLQLVCISWVFMGVFFALTLPVADSLTHIFLYISYDICRQIILGLDTSRLSKDTKSTDGQGSSSHEGLSKSGHFAQ